VRRLLQLAGEAYLLGSGALALLLMLLSMAGIRWSRGLMFVAALAAVVIAIVAIRRAGPFERPRITWATLIDVVTAVLIAGYARVATLAPPAESDFYGIWGVKAKQFFMTGGIDWRFLENPLNVPAHVDYPILLPLLYDVQALLAGAWPEERWLGLIHIASGVAALLVIRGLLAEEMPRLAGAAMTLILTPLICSPYFGLPEGLLAAYGTVALLFLRRALRDGDSAAALRGAVYLGLAASCKNEGLTLAVAAFAALALFGGASRWTVVARLWPAPAIVLPWLLLRGLHGLSANDLMAPGMFDRLLDRAAHPSQLIGALWAASGQPLLWAGIALACIVGLRQILRMERFFATAILIQLLFFIGAYLVTPHDLASHVAVTWERIVRQLLPAMVLLGIVSTVIRFRPESPECH
jgi:hypothetical protein